MACVPAAKRRKAISTIGDDLLGVEDAEVVLLLDAMYNRETTFDMSHRRREEKKEAHKGDGELAERPRPGPQASFRRRTAGNRS